MKWLAIILLVALWTTTGILFGIDHNASLHGALFGSIVGVLAMFGE